MPKLNYLEQGSYQLGSLLPKINQDALYGAIFLQKTSLDKYKTLVATKNENFDLNDLFNFDTLLGAVTLIHEFYHYQQDLFLGCGHLAYELQSLMYQDLIRALPDKSKRFDRLANIQESIFGNQGKNILFEFVDKNTSPSYDWEIIERSSGLSLLETHAALMSYFDIHRRLNIIPEVLDLLDEIEIKNLQPIYSDLYQYFMKAVIGMRAEEFSSYLESVPQFSKQIFLNLQNFASLILEISLHIPPLELFYYDWGKRDLHNKWLQFLPIYRFVACCGAIDHLNDQTSGQFMLDVIYGKSNYQKIMASIENLYGWFPYNFITDAWLEYYQNLQDKNAVDGIRLSALVKKKKNPFICRVESLWFIDKDTPLIYELNNGFWEHSNTMLHHEVLPDSPLVKELINTKERIKTLSSVLHKE